MQIIKEFQKHSFQAKGKPVVETTTCYLRPEKPDSSFETLTALFEEARRDFPGLQKQDVSVRTAIKRGSREIKVDENGMARAPNLIDSAIIEGIQFRTEKAPPRSYRELPSSGLAQG